MESTMKCKQYFRIEWDEFFEIYNTLKGHEELTNALIEKALEDWPEDQGFGSSDRWHVVFGELGSMGHDGTKPIRDVIIERYEQCYLETLYSFYFKLEMAM